MFALLHNHLIFIKNNKVIETGIHSLWRTRPAGWCYSFCVNPPPANHGARQAGLPRGERCLNTCLRSRSPRPSERHKVSLQFVTLCRDSVTITASKACHSAGQSERGAPAGRSTLITGQPVRFWRKYSIRGIVPRAVFWPGFFFERYCILLFCGKASSVTI